MSAGWCGTHILTSTWVDTLILMSTVWLHPTRALRIARTVTCVSGAVDRRHVTFSDGFTRRGTLDVD